MRKVNVLAALVICLSLVPAIHAGEAKANSTAQPVTRPVPVAVKDLLQLRVAAAEDGMRLAEKMYQSGTGSAEDTVAWSQRWLDARLAAAETPADRRAVLEAYVDLAKAREQVAETRFKSGLATQLETQAAHYFRIDAELRLARHLADGGSAGNGQPAPGPGQADRTDHQMIQGTWRVVGMVRNGKATPEQELKDEPSTLRFEGETAIMTHGKAAEERKEGAFRLDPSKAPKQVSIEPKDAPADRKGMTGIYDLKGDTLRIAFRVGKDPDTPPTDFEQGEGLGLMTLERQKDGKGGKEAEADRRQVQGTWKVVRKVKNGEPEDVAAHPVTLKFAGDEVTQSQGDGGKESRGSFAIDGSKTPKRITLTGRTGDHAGVVFEAIYELDGDTLKLAYGTGDNVGTPPKDFTGGEGTGLLVLERQKP